MNYQRSSRRSVFVLISLLLIIVAAGCDSKRPEKSRPPYRLALLLVIDQGGYETVERFRHLYKHGLKRLMDQGTIFSRAFHEHAVPSTAPGHAAIATGTHPRRSGIIDNDWYDRRTRRDVYCVEDARHGRSPRNLLVPTIGDWLVQHEPQAKVVTISGKDRGAIILGGHRALGAFWYDKSRGLFTTSPYYPLHSARWLRGAADTWHAERYLGKLWSPLAETEAIKDQRLVSELNYGDFPNRFPHGLGAATTVVDADFARAVYQSPFVDELTIGFTKEAIRNENLGGDDTPDILGISLSALDTVGHHYGPHSPEALDTLLRIDLLLGDLFTFLDSEVGYERVLTVLTADHGVMPFPEYLKRQNVAARRETAEDRACLQQAAQQSAEALGVKRLFQAHLYLATGLTLDRTRIDSVVNENLARCPTAARLWSSQELLSELSLKDDDTTRSYHHSFNPERSPDYFIQRKNLILESAIHGTTHTSPYDYDRHVPLIILSPGTAPRTIEDRVGTVDIAPTVASLLGIAPPRELDGTILSVEFGNKGAKLQP